MRWAVPTRCAYDRPMEALEDRNLAELVPLTAPQRVKADLPTDPERASVVAAARDGIRDVLHGRDRDRLVVICGPCSIHDQKGALDYAQRLARVADELSDQLLVVMRTYFEKPRTTVGWKGLVNDPRLDGTCDIQHGLRLAREILLEIAALGLPCATEFLDPVTPQYLDDLICWAAIGARTTESQTHREMASGLSMPVGFKNGTDGSLQVALDAMISARHPHSFLGMDGEGRTAVVRTLGNPDRHVVLRGGASRPNYHAADVGAAVDLFSEEDLARPVMVDCSHDQTAKVPERQPEVARDVFEQFGAGQSALMGIMIESNLRSGRQTWRKGVPLEYGVSITDGCIGWDATEALLHELADLVAAESA